MQRFYVSKMTKVHMLLYETKCESKLYWGLRVSFYFILRRKPVSDSLHVSTDTIKFKMANQQLNARAHRRNCFRQDWFSAFLSLSLQVSRVNILLFLISAFKLKHI